MMISNSMSLLAAGVAASGFFLYIGLRSRKNSKAREPKRVIIDNGRCACCLAPFRVGCGVRCSDCGARSCRKACSRWDTSDNAWHCIFCYQQRLWLKRNDKWFDNFGGAANEEEPRGFFGTAKAHVADHAAAIPNVEQIPENWEARCMVHAVRKFVEKIVDGLVENVDDVPIDRIYGDSEYGRFLEEFRPPLIAALTRLATCLEASLTNKPSTDPPAMAHAALREIVERAVEEARKLPGLNASADAEHPREGRAVADNSYEDLLATAILNKVIERYQRERVDGNSNVLHDTDSPKAKYTANESEHGLGEDATSYASDRLACNGDHGASIGSEDHRKPVSFMMEERIEEVTTITSDDDELRDGVLEFGCSRRVPFPEYGMDIIDPPRELPSPSPSTSSDSSDLHRNEHSSVRTKRHAGSRTMDIVSPIESWEDNWLFQKKRTSRSQPDAVAMLVPSSNAYYKALIGDRDAEDTSDLSECSSTKSDEEIEKELIEAINNVIPRTPRISECDATNNQTESNQEGATTVQQFGKDEVDTCQVITKTETNVTCERFDGKSRKELLKSAEVSEKKANECKDDRSNLNGSSFASTVAKEEGGTKEKPKDTAERGERTIATAVESSGQKEVKTQSEKSSERSDRGENVADENEEQRESEYTEHYDTAIQRHLDSLTKVEVYSVESETPDETRKMMSEQLRKSTENNFIKEPTSKRSETEVQLSYATIGENHDGMISENDPLSAPPRPGTIAEREHKKWENAPPIENNPYSEESIRKRCLERQYSKSSDIPGFGRDYYINQSKVATGERQEPARSAMSSMSSRPSSSLSQRSSCAGDEQHERQVSHDKLEQFEAASLRDSLPRRCCRDPRASPHFAINPLLHLESANDRSRHGDGERDECLVGNDIRMIYERENPREDARDDRGSKNSVDSYVGAISEREEDNHVLAENPEAGTDSRKSAPIDWNRSWDDREESVDHEEPIVPRYDNRAGSPGDRDDRDPGDHDSGMCSIGSRDSENSEHGRWRQLYRVADNDRPGGGGQISSIGGRKFWTTGGYKYHTFGGIRIRPRKTDELDDDLEDQSASMENSFEDPSSEFAKLKFQTFGGIKRSRRIDGRRIRSYRRIRLRPILLDPTPVVSGTEDSRDFVETEEESANIEHSDVNSGNCDQPTSLNRSMSFEGFASFEHSTSSTFEESDWQDEKHDVTDDRVSMGCAQIGCNRNRTGAFRTSSTAKRKSLIRKKSVNSSSLWSSPNEDDEWQDEIDCSSDEIIMNKFLKDVSRRRKACAFNDDGVAVRGRGTRSRRHREVLEDVNSEKLGKSITRNSERNPESWKESRQEGESDDKGRCKKLYVRSLSDVTIW
ncbi:PREDICTED: uncharacterized protein LOC105564451 isoform X2 [Vollenhovia emeryi]|uniref:uncharacterized protein LOC105564451 isoform X2 n=1 Tax=Vollenhovia emeryi TaxID=411798 RepID=UPI0005F3F7F5|nr:PREDICTED: uncharacterized protein LOC105564451 isoform X2 [Vollenhovia emeryi]